MIRVHFDVQPHIHGVIRHTFGTLMNYLSIAWEESNQGPIRVGHSEKCDIYISEKFAQLIAEKKFNHETWFDKEPLLYGVLGADYLGTCAYMLNGWQELSTSSDDYDQYNRYKYNSSWQKRFNCIDKPKVQDYFEHLTDALPALSSKRKSQPSRLFISHDMDRISRAFISESKWALTKLKITDVIQLGLDKVAGRSSWANMDNIMDLVEKYDYQSTFFWLVEPGKGLQNIENADYSFEDIIQAKGWLDRISNRGFNNGLHKAATSKSFEQEKARFKDPAAIVSNRNHYLKINLNSHYEALEAGGILFDSSVGFAEHAGYRLGYGNAFVPYCIKEDRPYNVVESPLLLMDVTLCQNMYQDIDEAIAYTKAFIRRNKSNHILSLLWHNNYITDRRYNERKRAFEEILAFAREEGIESCHPQDLIDEHLSN